MQSSHLRIYAAGTIFTALLSFLTLPVVSWSFNVEDVGRFAMLQTATSFSILFFGLGLDISYVREYHGTNNKHRLLMQTFAPGFILLCIVSVVILLTRPQAISQFLYGVNSFPVAMATVAIFMATYFQRFISLRFRLIENARSFALLQITPKLFFLLTILGFTLAYKDNEFHQLVISLCATLWLATLAFTWQMRDEIVLVSQQKINHVELRGLFAYGLPLVLVGLASWCLSGLDKFLLRGISTYEQLGVYSVATSIAAGAAILSNLFNTIWAPLVFKWESEGIALEKMVSVSRKINAAIYFVFVLSGLFSWLLPLMLPNAYEGVQYLIAACLFLPLMYTMSEVMGIGLHLARKTRHLAFAYAAAVALNLVLNYQLIPAYGAGGAAIGSAVSSWALLLLRAEFSSRLWQPMPRGRVYLSSLICLLISVGSILASGSYVKAVFLPWALALLVGICIFRDVLAEILIEMKRRLTARRSR